MCDGQRRWNPSAIQLRCCGSPGRGDGPEPIVFVTSLNAAIVWSGTRLVVWEHTAGALFSVPLLV